MSNNENYKLINFIGEFKNNIEENEFIEQDMKKLASNIKVIILVLGIINTLFLIPDYLNVPSKNSFYLIAAGRIFFLFLVVFLFYGVKSMKKFKMLTYWITGYELFCVMLFSFVFFQYDNPDYLIQAFGVMVIIIGIFIIPNRFIYMAVISAVSIISFNIMALYYIDELEFSEFSAGLGYLVIVYILCMTISLKDNYYKRINYITNKKLIKLSKTDPLTGIYNRAKLNEELNRCINYSKRYDADLSVVMIDLDDFKIINDNYGHLIGDSMILGFVKIVNENIRKTDIFARWGGEEFVLILPNTDIDEAKEILERVRITVECNEFEKVDKLTCSIGVAQLSKVDDNYSILQKADQMLYSAKDAGKNIVMG